MDPLSKGVLLEPTRKALSLYEEFKAFAFKGNVIDLAVGVIIGAAFGKIVESLVKHIIMPLVALLLPAEQSYLNWQWKDVRYGLFLGEVVNFLIVALALFLFLVKFGGWILRKKQEEAPAPLTKEQELLTEIRDLLKQRVAGPAP